MRSIVITSHRVAYHLNKHSTTNYKKESIIECENILGLLLSDDTDHEEKKVFFNQIIDMCAESDFQILLEKSSGKIEEMMNLVKELQNELKSGEWERKEQEFEILFEKIQHRKKIIGDL
jgi:hypothetical protein